MVAGVQSATMSRSVLTAVAIMLSVATGHASANDGTGLPEDTTVVETPQGGAAATPDGSVEATPVPEPVATEAPYGRWDRLAVCESHGDWTTNTGNGYYGGIQADMTAWRSHGGQQYASRPDLASREQQIVVAERILSDQGWGAWPICSRIVGLR